MVLDDEDPLAGNRGRGPSVTRRVDLAAVHWPEPACKRDRVVPITPRAGRQVGQTVTVQAQPCPREGHGHGSNGPSAHWHASVPRIVQGRGHGGDVRNPLESRPCRQVEGPGRWQVGSTTARIRQPTRREPDRPDEGVTPSPRGRSGASSEGLPLTRHSGWPMMTIRLRVRGMPVDEPPLDGGTGGRAGLRVVPRFLLLRAINVELPEHDRAVGFPATTSSRVSCLNPTGPPLESITPSRRGSRRRLDLGPAEYRADPPARSVPSRRVGLTLPVRAWFVPSGAGPGAEARCGNIRAPTTVASAEAPSVHVELRENHHT